MVARLSSTQRCKRLEKITREVTDRTLDLYDQGKMVEFLGSVEAIALLQEVTSNICEIGE